jgi:hypothetical protein
MNRKRTWSGWLQRPAPSAMLAPTESAHRSIWMPELHWSSESQERTAACTASAKAAER